MEGSVEFGYALRVPKLFVLVEVLAAVGDLAIQTAGLSFCE